MSTARGQSYTFAVLDEAQLLTDDVVVQILDGPKKARRGTTNRNDRGSSYARRIRREWLVTTYRADKDLGMFGPCNVGWGEPACRCYRCGDLLTVDTVTADRIKPGIEGGTYARANIRPACGHCNSSTGQALAIARRKSGKRAKR